MSFIGYIVSPDSYKFEHTYDVISLKPYCPFKMLRRSLTHKPKNALVQFDDDSRSIIKIATLRPQDDIKKGARLTALWDGQWLNCTVLEVHVEYNYYILLTHVTE